MGMGLRFQQGMALRQRDLCSETMGFSKNLGWEMGIGSPFQDPLVNMENEAVFDISSN